MVIITYVRLDITAFLITSQVLDSYTASIKSVILWFSY